MNEEVARGCCARCGRRHGCTRAILSKPAGHHPGSARARRIDRHDRPHHGGSHPAASRRSSGDRRKRARRRRIDRRDPRRALDARRLPDADRPVGHQCREWRGLQSADRPADRSRARRADRDPALHDHRQEGFSGQQSQGDDRPHQSQSREGYLRQCRHRQPGPCGRRVLPEHHRRRKLPSCHIAAPVQPCRICSPATSTS